jgi:hypothetical protein
MDVWNARILHLVNLAGATSSYWVHYARDVSITVNCVTKRVDNATNVTRASFTIRKAKPALDALISNVRYANWTTFHIAPNVVLGTMNTKVFVWSASWTVWIAKKTVISVWSASLLCLLTRKEFVIVAGRIVKAVYHLRCVLNVQMGNYINRDLII